MKNDPRTRYTVRFNGTTYGVRRWANMGDGRISVALYNGSIVFLDVSHLTAHL